MKKSLLLLPLIALGLTACNSGSSEAPATAAEVTSVAMPDWQNSNVQPVEMPTTMGTPLPQPIPQALPPMTSQPSYAQGSGQIETIGNCQVVRDSANTPIYAQIQKGCYTNESYTVGKQDTVFLIAYLSGQSVADIARLNNLTPPYQLKMGQVLRLK